MATKKKPQWAVFAESCCGGVTGWLVVHPLDVLKVRLQLAGGAKVGTFTVAKTLVANEGPLALYSGLSAALMRQVVYTTSRLAFYEIIRDAIAGDSKNVSFATRAFSGPTAGGLAALISCPVEVSLVRMQADGRLPANQRRNYKHIFDALIRISREEGVPTYWRGAAPTVTRAMVVGLTQVGCYDQFKDMYKSYMGFKEGTSLYLTASVTAGLVYSFASLPFDTTKTRMQSQSPLPDGTLKYKTTLGTMMGIVKTEGVGSLWKGFGAYFGRSGGHTVCMFFALEQYKKLFAKMY